GARILHQTRPTLNADSERHVNRAGAAAGSASLPEHCRAQTTELNSEKHGTLALVDALWLHNMCVGGFTHSHMRTATASCLSRPFREPLIQFTASVRPSVTISWQRAMDPEGTDLQRACYQ